MLHPFVSVTASGRIHPAVTTFSAAVHGAILLLAIAPTPQHVRYTEKPKAALEQVQYAVTFGKAPVRAARVSRTMPPRVETSSGSSPHAVLVDFHGDLPVVTAPASNEGEHNGTNDLNAVAVHAVAKPAPDVVYPDVPYEMADVEVQAEPSPTNPKPVYPPAMQRRQLQARFAVYFVVDTSGRIDPTSIELPLVSHEEFLNSVLVAMEKWTFEPAQIRGRRVRERVKQPFTFKLK
jgi:TonB family protein